MVTSSGDLDRDVNLIMVTSSGDLDRDVNLTSLSRSPELVTIIRSDSQPW
jgi:hypothetical protein